MSDLLLLITMFKWSEVLTRLMLTVYANYLTVSKKLISNIYYHFRPYDTLVAFLKLNPCHVSLKLPIWDFKISINLDRVLC